MFLLLFFLRAPETIDTPLWDESNYFYRGFALTQGRLDESQVLDPRTSPLQAVHYALWYGLLHTSELYPAILISSLSLLTLSAYALYRRLFSPVISWLLAVLTLVLSAPVIPVLANYTFGTAILWFGLSLPDRRLWRRSLGLLVVLLSTCVRPEFNLCLLTLAVGLAVVETRDVRRGQRSTGRVLIAYAPVLIAGVVTLGLWSLPRSAASTVDRTLAALPWSYNNFLEAAHPDRFGGSLTYTHPLVVFERDFGPVEQPVTLTGTLGAMARRPGLLAEYLGYNGARLAVSLLSSLARAYRWTLGVNLPTRVTALSLAAALVTALTATGALLGLRRWLRCRGLSATLNLSDRGLTWLCLLSLTPIIGGLLLINPQQRFFMIFPLVLVWVGVGLTWLARLLSVPSWTPALVVVAVLALAPHPFDVAANRPVAATLDALRQSLPRSGAALLARPANSYRNVLAAEGFDFVALDPANFDAPVLVNAVKAVPSLNYVLTTDALPEPFWAPLFDEWRQAFPRSGWSLVARSDQYGFRLYKLP